jgi:hypothetical protein
LKPELKKIVPVRSEDAASAISPRRCDYCPRTHGDDFFSARVGRKHVFDQRLRIERHKELTAKLERDGDADVVAKARQLLADMPPRSNA